MLDITSILVECFVVCRGIARCDTIWDRLVFRKIRQGLGGRVRLMVVGSAPTSDEVLNFFRCALSGSEEGDGTVANGYGQTEGVAGAFLSLPYETEPGMFSRCGSLLYIYGYTVLVF